MGWPALEYSLTGTRASFLSRGSSCNATAVIALAVLAIGFQSALAQGPRASLDAWTLIFERPGAGIGRYEDLAFPDERNGWMVSYRGEILHTVDGGRSWALQATGLRNLRSVDFLDLTRGFAGTVTGMLYGTTDGGATWIDITPRLPKATKGFCGITHVGNEVHMVGRYLGATDYFFSPDAGMTWQHADLGDLAQGLVDVAFISRDIGFIGGMANSARPGQGAPTILKTTDGGKHWRSVYQDNGGRGHVWKLFPVSPRTIFASLQSEDGIYRIAKSTDGGDTWTTIVVAAGQRMGPMVQAVGFLDEKIGFVGGFVRGMWGTTDGGDTWRRVAIPHGSINRFERVGTTLITGSSGGVLRFNRAPKAR
jgi:photosystem II stability/assembly factor-like uncharacterized protein